MCQMVIASAQTATTIILFYQKNKHLNNHCQLRSEICYKCLSAPIYHHNIHVSWSKFCLKPPHMMRIGKEIYCQNILTQWKHSNGLWIGFYVFVVLWTLHYLYSMVCAIILAQSVKILSCGCDFLLFVQHQQHLNQEHPQAT